MSSHSSDFIGTSPIPKLLMRFALPAMASSFVNCLYNIVDRLYIGRGAGPDAMAGLSLTFPYMIILASFGMMIGQGSGALISLLLGEKKPEEANKVLGQAMAMFILFIFTIQALGLIFLDQTLHLFGGTEAAIPYARDYLVIILWGNIFQHISFGMSNIVRSEGSAMTAMGVVILGAALNIVLDPIFIFVFHMGIRGAAWATVISMAISSAWVMAHFLRGSVLTLHIKNIRIYPKLFTRVLTIGLAPCLMQILHCLIVIIYNHSFIAYASSDTEATLAIAAFGINNSVLMMALMPSFGINMGMQPIIGYNTGAKLYSRVMQTIKLAVSLATVICLVLALVCIVFANQIAFIFTPDKPLIETTVYSLRTVSCGLPFIGIGILTGTYYLSIGRSSISIVLSMLRQGIVLLPVLLTMPRFLGLKGIWWAGPFSDSFSAILCFAILCHESFRLKKLIKE